MSKVIFIIVPSCSNNDWLDAKMMQITKAFIYTLNRFVYPIEIVESYNDINLYLDKADWLVVSTAGNIIVERDHIWNKLHSIPDDIGLLAHILQFEGHSTPWIHEQFFIINTKAFKNKTISFDEYQDFGGGLIRSAEDMHDGHAPLSVTFNNRKIVQRDFQFGTKLILDTLLSGYRVSNFDYDWRYPNFSNNYVSLDKQTIKLPSRGYAYPKVNTELFAKALKERTLHPELDEAQSLLIYGIQEVLKFNVLNAWHYEIAISHDPADKVICPATGFLGELMAFQSGAKQLVLYDKNINNIQFKQDLYSLWDGINYDQFVTDWASKRSIAVEPTVEKDKEVAKEMMNEVNEKVLSNWNKWKESINIEFVHCDLLTDVNVILNKVCDKTILNTSTILSLYPFTHMIYDTDVINQVRDNIAAKMLETNSRWDEA